jgi:N-acyl-D-aspartate/D-glutamate deacylase
MGAVDEQATRTIDATGLVVAPGFVDLHTHYDAQLFWDPTASPSPLHGVTTVFGGNCGFGLAPAGADHADYLARLMSRVEGIPLPALEAGLDWDWTSFADWSARLGASGMAVNAGFMAGHSPIRRLVMGDDAVGATATPAQITAMADVLRTCLASGAMGLSTSRAPTHHDGDGNPVPSRSATDDELLALCAVVGEHPGTQLEAIVPGCLNGFSDDEVDLLTAMSATAQRPLNWNVLGIGDPDSYKAQLHASDRARAGGGRVVALTLPHSMSIRLSFASGWCSTRCPAGPSCSGSPSRHASRRWPIPRHDADSTPALDRPTRG